MSDTTWRVDGRIVGHGAKTEWSLWPGKHVLELHDGRRPVDRIVFEVRGAEVRRTVAANTSR